MIIWHVFIFNYVEFTQGKLRIARDTTVNDYLCCKGVKCLGLSFTHSSLTMTRAICRSRVQITHHKCYMSLISQSVAHTFHDAYFKRHL